MIGKRIGQYEILAELGAGGMAVVYRAYQSAIDRDVAIKVIKPERRDDGEFLKRFQREARTIASLSHPHIVKVFDYGEHEGTVYLVMELLKGGSLADIVSRGPMPLNSG
jgi:serine/threonine-protein kinase